MSERQCRSLLQTLHYYKVNERSNHVHTVKILLLCENDNECIFGGKCPIENKKSSAQVKNKYTLLVN